MNKVFTINGKEIEVQDFQLEDQKISFYLHGKKYFYTLIEKKKGSLVLESGKRFRAHVESGPSSQEIMTIANGVEAKVLGEKKAIRSTSSKGGGELISPMPGKIFKILKAPGSSVKKGEAILIVEAMKMEHSIKSDKDGVLKKIHFKEGDLVLGGVSLAEVEE